MNNENSNLVSVIIPTYNCATTIINTLRAIDLQVTNYQIEVIVSDDCSTDNTLETINNYNYKNVLLKIIRNNENVGAAEARNKAINAATGRYIMFCDADDIWHKKKIYKQINFMKKNNISFSYTNYSVFDDDINDSKEVICKPYVTYHDLLLFNHICCSTVCYDTKKFGKRQMPNIRKRQDYALWLSMIKEADRFMCLSEILMYKKIGYDSISNNKLSLLKYNFKVLNDFEKIPWPLAIYYLTRLSFTKLFRILKR